MEEFNKLRKYPKVFKLKELEKGNYNVISLKEIETRFGDSVIAKIEVDDGEQDFFLAKKHGQLSDGAINEINKGKHKFIYKGMIFIYKGMIIYKGIDNKYVDKIKKS